MATLLWHRDLSTDASNIRNTFTSWDSCMSKTYCKWPVIAGIIIGSLILLSLLWCVFRCLCCGAECCCGCLACCNACCPSPRRGHRGKDGYYQQPPPQPAFQPAPYQSYPQYQSAPPPVYGAAGGGYRGAQTATFDVPGKNGAPTTYNEDALPPMPSWDNAASRHVEEDDVEMEKLDHPQAQQQSLLPNQQDPYRSQQQQAGGDIGAMYASPYHDEAQQRQHAVSPVSAAANSVYPPTYHTSPVSTMYEPARQSYGAGYEPQGQQYGGSYNQPSQQYGGGYTPSVAPSYHTTVPGPVSPPPQNAGFTRKPVQGSWRDV